MNILNEVSVLKKIYLHSKYDDLCVLQIGNKTKAAEENNIKRKLIELQENILALQKNITDNANSANSTIEESVNTLKKAERTKADSEQLQDSYKVARQRLNDTLDKVQKANERANNLSKKALDMVAKVQNNKNKIQMLQESSQDPMLEELEAKLNGLIKKMEEYTMTLERKVEYYKTCN